ncbi:UbiA prenyltransferase family protein [Aestuariibaculum suncheonense]|uniref:Prenyltransferase n=1 Tax=Aestuariibaculum suncheonense TaxID=1028745 RepID=A0A8J6UAE6_9FLAO|nr:hypothetical protein [Aestuariibaculum suncheonense]MBD0834287.1 hypothetical protein [Aestuariibaculum suncheonense]
MKIFKQLLNFYINSSLHVAFAVVALTWITLLEFHISFDKYLLTFVFFASVTGYNFVKYFGIAKFHHRSLSSWLKAIQILSFFCFVFMCYYLMKLKLETLLFIVGCGVVTFFYAIPFLPKRFYLDSKQNLRNIGGLKVYLIALVWSGVTVFLPVINSHYSIDADVILTAIQRLIFIIVIMLPFEIRDLSYDSLRLATIPQKMGVQQTKVMGMVLLGIFYALEFFKDNMVSGSLLVMFLISAVTLYFVKHAEVKQGQYYSSFWVEGLPILWLLLLLIFN